MSMSTHVIGFRPPDEKWRKMKAVWDASEAAGIDPPEEVLDFFNHEPPDPQGVEVEIPVRECRPHDGASGYEVDVASLPKDVTVIRFWNAW